MRQLVFIDKDKEGKDRVFTTSKTGKMLFPHKDLKIDFDSITVLDDFEIVVEKENYGFFKGKKVDVCLPEPKDLTEHISEIKDLKVESFTEFHTAGSFYTISGKDENVLITQEVESGDIVIIEESRFNYKTRTGKNPHYYAIYNSMTSMGKKYVDFKVFMAKVFLSIERELSIGQKASIAWAAHTMGYFDKESDYTYMYYDKCIVKFQKEYGDFKLYYIADESDPFSVDLEHDELVDIIKSKSIEVVNAMEYKDAVDKCFEEGFGPIAEYSSGVAALVYEDTLEKPMPNEFFGALRDYREDSIYVMNINKYDVIKRTLTDDQIKALAKLSKDKLNKIDTTIKQLGRCATKEAISKITKMNYKRAITIAV